MLRLPTLSVTLIGANLGSNPAVLLCTRATVSRSVAWVSRRIGNQGPQRMVAMHLQANGAPPRHVAVVGAGAAGLAAAHEALRAGLQVTVLEAEDDLGGVWRYTDAVESDPLGTDPKRRKVQSSMYRDLRCNLPRQCMAYLDFPFEPEAMLGRSEDDRVFCSHTEVMAYLRAFAEQYSLDQHIMYRTAVNHIRPLQQEAPSNGSKPKYTWPRWRLHLQQGSQEQQMDVDAVMVCNGHYTEPRLPALPGQDSFPGLQMHSHNYRTRQPFSGKRVVVVGAAASGIDIGLEIAQVADQVWLCSKSWPEEADPAQPMAGTSNLWRRGAPSELASSGAVHFESGEPAADVDVVLYSSGYRYSLPFLDASSRVASIDNRIAPLYKQILAPHWGPSLALLGLPFKVAPFPLYQAQARWVASLLTGATQLPSEADMLADCQAWDEEVASSGLPIRYTHMLGERQWQYADWLIQQTDPSAKPLPGYRQALYQAAQKHRSASPESYRDRPMAGPALEAAEREAASWLQLNAERRTAVVV